MRQFRAAMALTGSEFTEAVQYYAKVRGPALPPVRTCEFRLRLGPLLLWAGRRPQGSTRGQHSRTQRWPPGMEPPLLLALFSARCLEFQRSNARPLPLLRLQSWLPARKHVKEALDQRKEVHPSGEATGRPPPPFPAYSLPARFCKPRPCG